MIIQPNLLEIKYRYRNLLDFSFLWEALVSKNLLKNKFILFSVNFLFFHISAENTDMFNKIEITVSSDSF